MDNEFERILDECIDRLNRGESIEACLKDYPEQANELAPLLQAITQTQQSCSFVPSPDAKRAARQTFFAALEKKRVQPSFWQKVFGRRLVWATVAAVVVIALGAYFTLRTTVFPSIPTNTIASPAPDGNFAFLVSDDVNAIAEFSEVNVTIEKVALLKIGDSSEWIEFMPETKTFDLSKLPGETTQELWRGDIPVGQYTKVVIYVSEVNGILKSTGEITEIKLPSNKLQINSSFEVSSDAVTSFTYDLTVIKTGNEHNVKYILKPQAGESGAIQLPLTTNGTKDKGKGNSNK
ncbi:MAG: DUF4382 domain-containing protein [Dehalococcoidales bacterium]|nr:DUF4382 domain-containing protein [Dehalococcoidales bacterium]